MPIHRRHHHHRHHILNNQEDATTTRTPINIPNFSPKPNSRKLLYFLLRSIIMALVLSLFLFFLGIAALVLLHFFLSSSASSFHRHRYRHHHPRSSSSFAAATQSPSYTIQELHKYLPSFGYSVSEVEITKDCAICLECFKEGEMCRKLPACDHVLHMRCVDEWLTKVPSCPICRSRVQLYFGVSSSIIADDDSKLLWISNLS